VANKARLGFITCCAEKLPCYFPTRVEPDFLPSEPPFTPDDQLAVDCLREMGHTVEAVVWGMSTEELSNFDGLVMRSPWDYMDTDKSRARFIEWLRELELSDISVQNSPELMLWLGDKHYLADFQSVGIPIVPTEFLPAGTDPRSLELSYPAVLKPAVSAAAQGLFFLRSRSEHTAELGAALRHNAYLVQDFIPEIKQTGEWSLIYLDGVYSHAVHKLPGPNSILVHAEQGGALRFDSPPMEVKLFGDQVSEALGVAFEAGTGRSPQTPLYLRIDVIPSACGPLLSECEGVEPELFFRVCPGSEKRFARALLGRLKKTFASGG
jgi:hypothetical protein